MPSNNLQPIFEPIRAKYKPLGIPLAKFIGIIVACLLGLSIAFALSGWKHEAPVEYSILERQNLRLEMDSYVTVLASLEQQRQESGLQSIEALPMTSEQTQILNRAKELGISAQTTSEELDKLVPLTHIDFVDVIPLPLRIAIFAGLPLLIGILLFIEPEGTRTSVYKELKRYFRFRKEQKSFKSLPVEYVERTCGVPYYQATIALNSHK